MSFRYSRNQFSPIAMMGHNRSSVVSSGGGGGGGSQIGDFFMTASYTYASAQPSSEVSFDPAGVGLGPELYTQNSRGEGVFARFGSDGALRWKGSIRPDPASTSTSPGEIRFTKVAAGVEGVIVCTTMNYDMPAIEVFDGVGNTTTLPYTPQGTGASTGSFVTKLDVDTGAYVGGYQPSWSKNVISGNSDIAIKSATISADGETAYISGYVDWGSSVDWNTTTGASLDFGNGFSISPPGRQNQAGWLIRLRISDLVCTGLIITRGDGTQTANASIENIAVSPDGSKLALTGWWSSSSFNLNVMIDETGSNLGPLRRTQSNTALECEWLAYVDEESFSATWAIDLRLRNGDTGTYTTENYTYSIDIDDDGNIYFCSFAPQLTDSGYTFHRYPTNYVTPPVVASNSDNALPAFTMTKLDILGDVQWQKVVELSATTVNLSENYECRATSYDPINDRVCFSWCARASATMTFPDASTVSIGTNDTVVSCFLDASDGTVQHVESPVFNLGFGNFLNSLANSKFWKSGPSAGNIIIPYSFNQGVQHDLIINSGETSETTSAGTGDGADSNKFKMYAAEFDGDGAAQRLSTLIIAIDSVFSLTNENGVIDMDIF
ncbi:MAG: hypothetical protein QNK24_10360 [Desulfuromusa sp.]|nr:hypothetical protein [Desulfuromusa sp.]